MTGYMEMAKCNRKQRLLGKSIRRIRMRRNMTQRELANAAGLGESAFRSYELGERSPKQNTLERIAKALDVAPACFDTYGIEHYDELMHALFLSEEAFGIKPCADGSIRFTDETIQSSVFCFGRCRCRVHARWGEDVSATLEIRLDGIAVLG